MKKENFKKVETVVVDESNRKSTRVTIITDGCDNDGRMSALYAYNAHRTDSKFVYLDRDKSVLEDPKWITRDSKNKELDIYDFYNKHVIFCDICLSYEDMIKIKEISKSLLIFDHHKVDDQIVKMNEYIGTGEAVPSATLLVANYYKSSHKLLGKYVSDRDTFTKKYKQSDWIFQSLDTFNDDYLLEVLDGNIDIEEILERGKEIQDDYNIEIEKEMKRVSLISHDGKRVAYIKDLNPKYISDVGNNSCKAWDVDYFVSVNKRDGKWFNSFRSLNEQALPIAKALGGGGHPNACGAVTDEKIFG